MKNKILGFLTVAVLATGALTYFFFNSATMTFFILACLLLGWAIFDVVQTKHSLMRSFPIIARLRWLFEHEREKIQQYFVESDLDGVPINREKRSIVYQRAKKEMETVPFGTQHDVYAKGYEFVKHSLFPTDHHKVEGDRITIGSKHCKLPYSSSLVNISAMSFGSLSKNAIMALNQGAKEGNFAHNTGEGGISPYHLQGGNLIFQVGTGYFGAGKTVDGKRVFDDEIFKKNAIRPEVKMIEIKFSQGAKPGHGGILPAKKNTEEIAKIRSVEPFTQVDSPPFHSAFSNYNEMIDFLQKVRDLSGGKPVGIKFCVGNQDEIEEMLATFARKGSYPDFIAVDGGEGGTGSAPLEFTNYIGTPLLEGLNFVHNQLIAKGLREEIKIVVSGKAIDGFDIVKLVAMGADTINMARSFMLSLGCIQARECNSDTCPVGVATQNEDLVEALVVEEKYLRVKNYHNKTVKAAKEMVSAIGKNSIQEVSKKDVFRRNEEGKIERFSDIYK